MKNTTDYIKEYDIKTIYFNCFDTWLEIDDIKKWKRALDLAENLNISTVALRNMLLLQNKELRHILESEVPYIFNSEKKVIGVLKAEEEIQAELQKIILKPSADVVLQELQHRWYKIWMISNLAYPYVAKIWELSPITFDYMLLSCALGMKKTIKNHEIYKLAHAKTWDKKREIVMIGDHETNDYDVANDYGLHTIHMDRKQKNTKPNRVRTIEELLELFPQKKI